ncbi:MAG: hypothetical protein JO020_03370, partial [Chloroflexi bacterium]|nr:hypothetical protein [Chloroflexota bacterium]
MPALGLPARDEDFVHAESARLFGERASAANREFRLTSANAPAVVDACRRLDGIPLAIELAAARARMFSVEQIAWHLGNQSLAWSSAAHATPARHTTLRAAIEWSYALLTPTEQALFRRLAVFAGSFSLQAAEAVCAGELAAIPDSAEVLCGLIDKSLVLAETRPTGEVRYRLLETLRQYAVERLHEAHEEHAVRMRQLDWLVTLTEQADPVHGGPDEPPYLALVPLEYDNCRAALEWAAQTPAAATLGLKLVIRLYRYWLINGLMNEGRRWNVLLRDAVTTLGLGPSLDLAWSLFLDSTLTVFQGEFDEGQRLAEAAVAMAQVLDQPAMAAEFRGLLATQQANRGDLASAAANNAAALAVLRTTGPEASLAGTLMGAATVTRLQGDDAQAIRFTEESLRIMQRIGLDFYVGHVV